VYRTRNGGRTWQRSAAGFPRTQGWFTVMRQAMSLDAEPASPRLYLGTTGGEIWADLGPKERWTCLVRHLPRIYSVAAVRFR
jgi:hypothetical protein